MARLDDNNTVAQVGSCTGVLLAVMFGIVFRRSFLRWFASSLPFLAIVLSVRRAVLDKLGAQIASKPLMAD
jgi:hypothetical protein